MRYTCFKVHVLIIIIFKYDAFKNFKSNKFFNMHILMYKNICNKRSTRKSVKCYNYQLQFNKFNVYFDKYD